MWAMIVDGTFHIIYERGLLVNVPQNLLGEPLEVSITK